MSKFNQNPSVTCVMYLCVLGVIYLSHASHNRLHKRAANS